MKKVAPIVEVAISGFPGGGFLFSFLGMGVYSLTGGFVIIDGDKGLSDLPEWVKEHLVLTNPMIGLTKELATQAVEILRK